MAHARAALPLIAVPLLVILLTCAVGHVSATASYVFGFCQAPYGALFEGGWNNAIAPSTGCHRGMFGVPGGDGSVFDSSEVSCSIPDASPTSGDSPTCTCLGVPQVSAWGVGVGSWRAHNQALDRSRSRLGVGAV